MVAIPEVTLRGTFGAGTKYLGNGVAARAEPGKLAITGLCRSLKSAQEVLAGCGDGEGLSGHSCSGLLWQFSFFLVICCSAAIDGYGRPLDLEGSPLHRHCLRRLARLRLRRGRSQTAERDKDLKRVTENQTFKALAGRPMSWNRLPSNFFSRLEADRCGL
jgi:hypothetical protein